MLGVEELFDLEEALKEELDEHLTEILTRLNRTECLEDFLCLLGMVHLLRPDIGYQVHKTGKIVVIGQSDVRAEVLLSVAAKLGLEKSRFDLHLEYEDAIKFNFRKMQWEPSYSAILVGPMPHSGTTKGDFSSIITAIENGEGYPPVIRLGANSLKITKSDFKAKLQELLDTKKIA